MVVMKYNSRNGFTLIELLVVVAIIGLLSSIVFASLNSARAKSRDSQRIQQFKNISTALSLYYDKHGRYPASPNNFPYNHLADFNAVVGTLVSEGFIATVPVSPSPGSYGAWDYGAGSAPGLIINVELESISPTTVPPFSSCRPFVGNWCSSTTPSTYYCLCHIY